MKGWWKIGISSMFLLISILRWIDRDWVAGLGLAGGLIQMIWILPFFYILIPVLALFGIFNGIQDLLAAKSEAHSANDPPRT